MKDMRSGTCFCKPEDKNSDIQSEACRRCFIKYLHPPSSLYRSPISRTTLSCLQGDNHQLAGYALPPRLLTCSFVDFSLKRQSLMRERIGNDLFENTCSLDKPIKVWVATESGSLELTSTHQEQNEK